MLADQGRYDHIHADGTVHYGSEEGNLLGRIDPDDLWADESIVGTQPTDSLIDHVPGVDTSSLPSFMWTVFILVVLAAVVFRGGESVLGVAASLTKKGYQLILLLFIPVAVYAWM